MPAGTMRPLHPIAAGRTLPSPIDAPRLAAPVAAIVVTYEPEPERRPRARAAGPTHGWGGVVGLGAVHRIYFGFL